MVRLGWFKLFLQRWLGSDIDLLDVMLSQSYLAKHVLEILFELLPYHVLLSFIESHEPLDLA